MRQAQRTYRAKRENALALAEERSAKLEDALRDMTTSFQTLQNHLLQASTPIPADFALHLSKTALEMACITNNSDLQSTPGVECDNDIISPSSLACAAKIVPERSLRASMQRTTNSLATGGPASSRLPTSLLDHLNSAPDETSPMQEKCQASETCLASGLKFPKPFGSTPPLLFRTVEGGDPMQMIPRLPPPHIQRLKFGQSRTWVHTNLPGLAGEWLEALDVEEYLSQRGIVLHENLNSGLINLELDSAKDNSAEAQPTRQTSPYLATDIIDAGRMATDWTIFGKQLHQRHSIPSGTRTFAASPNFWAEDDQSNFPPDLVSSQPVHHPAQDINTQPNAITINVDKLIEGLALRTICIGSSPGIRRQGVDAAIREAVVVPNGDT